MENHAIFLLFIVVAWAGRTTGVDLEQCTMPLGMESGEIPDSDITSSSSFEHGNVGPHIGRIRTENQGGAWCPKQQINSEAEEWIQIDLHTTRVITVTETQGRFGNGQGQEFAESYLISYWRPQLNKWVRYRDQSGNEILKGNINTYLPSKTELNPPIIASKIRIIPYSFHRRTVCMRVEIYGCLYRGCQMPVVSGDIRVEWTGILKLQRTARGVFRIRTQGGLLSYSMAQGSEMAENWELYDAIYDGQWDGQYLQNGLGQLTDGLGGPINFKDDFYSPERGKGWVGWKNETRNITDPLEILFKFDAVREFSVVHIHASNQFTKEIQVFSEARVFFSVGGKLYPGDPVLSVQKEDCIFEDPRNVSIKLLQRIGQYVKIQLFWASKWILISEITFDSQIAMGNFTEEETLIISTTPEVVPDILPPVNDSREFIDVKPPLNFANSIVENDLTVGEDVTSTTVVMTAIISSCIAVTLVLVITFVVFLMRNRLFSQVKIPPGSLPCSLHYGEVGFTSDGPNDGGLSDLSYVPHPGFLVASSSSNSKSPPTMASSLSRDYESRPSFASFMGLITNNAGRTNTNSTSNGMAEYYSSAPVQNTATFRSRTDDSDNAYETILKDIGSSSLQHKGALKNKFCSSLPMSPAFSRRHRQDVRCLLQGLDLPEISKSNLKLLRKLGDGVFGSIYVGELFTPSEGKSNQSHLITVKRLLSTASEKDKLDFVEEVRLLSSLNDPNVTQVLGLCTDEEPFCVALEFLEMGDLRQFLQVNDALQSTSTNHRLCFGDLLHLASQIASGMKFLERNNIVHRDLAARNCVVSRCLTVKVSHFAAVTGLYSEDYYQLDGKMPLPIRWMAWESIFLGKYSVKSDVWSMGVTLWEVLTFCRHVPYQCFSDQDVIHNLRRLSFADEADPFQALEHPYNCPRDVYELMRDTWRRNDLERPSFWEIHCFLTRKNINYNATRQRLALTSAAESSYYV